MNSQSPRDTLSTLLKSLEQRFSQPRKVYLQTLTDSRSLAGAGKRVLWVVGRGLLKHEAFTIAGDLPPAKRRAVLDLQIRRWSPFRTAQWAVLWGGNRASVFAWDREKVSAAIVAAGFDPARCKIVPEPFIRAPGANGIRLIAASDGYEAQAWDAGFLSSSRWWSTLPTLSDWAMTMRLARLSHQSQAIAPPQAVEVPLLEESWAVRRDPVEDALGLLEVPRYRVAAAIAVGALPLFLASQWVATATHSATLENEKANLLQASEGVRKQRQAALANLDTAEELLALEPYPSQFAVMQHAAQLLAPEQVKVVDWNYDNGALEFSVQSTGEIDATHLIEVFAKDEMFVRDSVGTTTVSPGGMLNAPSSLLRVKMKLTAIPGRS